MQVSLHNNVKTYNLTAGKSLPEWLSERRRRKGSRGSKGSSKGGELQRVELLHDFEFPHSARCLFRCADGAHFFAAGDYPHRLKCYDVNALSAAYSFNADLPIAGGVALSADGRRFALRGEGRQLTVHSGGGVVVDRLRVPHWQRCLRFDRRRGELLSSGVAPAIARLSLETGAFLESYATGCAAVNAVDVVESGPVSGLVLAGGTDGALEAWDSRAPRAATRLNLNNINNNNNNNGGEIRDIAVEEAGGLLFTCGNESGQVLLFDVRLQKPLLVKDHRNSLPIVKTYFFHGKSTSTGEASYILSADTRSVKIWNKSDGSNFTNIDAPGDITDFCLLRSQHNLVAPYECDDSGVLAICCDVPRVQVHFIPQLGVAPRWASFLENMTEELEEKEAATVYDDYTFLPKEEMDSMGITAQDLADGKVRPVMHGAFVENGLYRELKAVVDPGSFNRYLAENAKKKKEVRWGERISRFKRVAEEEEGEEEEGEQGAVGDGDKANHDGERASGKQNALAAAKADPRFAKAFDAATGKAATPAFSLDRSNPEYAKLLQTIEERRAKASERRSRYESDMFAVVPDTELDDHDDYASHGSSRHDLHHDEDQNDASPVEDEARRQLRGVQSSGKVSTRQHRRQHQQQQQQPHAEAGQKQERGNANSNASNRGDSNGRNGGRSVTMFEVDKANANVFTRNEKQIHASRKKQRVEKLTLEERLRRASKQK